MTLTPEERVRSITSAILGSWTKARPTSTLTEYVAYSIGGEWIGAVIKLGVGYIVFDGKRGRWEQENALATLEEAKRELEGRYL